MTCKLVLEFPNMGQHTLHDAIIEVYFMALNVSWRNKQKTILHQQFDGTWSLDDYYILLDETYDLLTTVNHDVTIIMDFSTNTTLTADILLSTGSASSLYVDSNYHENQRRVIMVNVSPLMKALVHMARHSAPRLTTDIIYVDSYKDALIHLSQLARSQM